MEIIHGFEREFIPSIAGPRFVTDYFGTDDDDVIVVETPDSARAYPVPILDLHHMVNDEIDGSSIVVTWCPLCGSGVVYDRVVEEQTLTFEFAGKLADNNFVMRDRETGSEWKQSTGECLGGDLEGETLSIRTARMTTYGEFSVDYPEGVVLARPDGNEPYLFYRFEKLATTLLSHPAGEEILDGIAHFVRAANLARDPEVGTSDVSIRPFFRFMQAGVELSDWVHGQDSSNYHVTYDGDPMTLYEGSRAFGFPPVHGGSREWDTRSDDLRAKTRVLGITTQDGALAFPRPRVEASGGVVRTTVGETDVIVFALHDELAAFKDPGIEFEPTDEEGSFNGDGTRWSGTSGASEDGRVLERLPGRWTFAFSWQTDHGPDAFYRADPTTKST
ncbi:DUF3179 domain-containing (seleno)protein (plasmid) [Haloferacaceae archaeon DSL9]